MSIEYNFLTTHHIIVLLTHITYNYNGTVVTRDVNVQTLIENDKKKLTNNICIDDDWVVDQIE